MPDQFGDKLAYVTRGGQTVNVPPKRGKHYVESRGYHGTPGEGPKGETCKTCKHIYRNRQAKTYLKCTLAKAKWTGGGASDIRAGSPACQFWESPKHEQQ